ncbi:MAG: DUF2189 domain-containing protein [Burkholderiales bacterium]|nr:DUF2189 domain-containing protein [Burkholderiales bacterium]
MSDNHIPAARAIGIGAPLTWLARGWRDMLASPLASLLHGVLVAAGGWGAVWLGQQAWLLLPGAFSGFLLIGPILATGLYELSRRRAAGANPGVGAVVAAWRRGTRPLVGLGLLLFGAASAWVAVSAVMFRLYVAQPIATLEAFLRYALAEQGTTLFWLWMLAGALGSALVFAVTAVSAPLLLDRRIGLAAAVLASVRAVGDNPLPMALWAAIIMLLTGLSMATWMAGFLVSVPLLGHATWHAYRDLVDAGAWPVRD